MQQAAVNDVGDRFELLNMALANKKIAAEADKVTREENPDRYWHQQLLLRNSKRKFAVNNYMEDIEMPDMTALAEERYQAEKDKYAAVPESRYTSHILFMCKADECERDGVRPLAEEVLAERSHRISPARIRSLRLILLPL